MSNRRGNLLRKSVSSLTLFFCALLNPSSPAWAQEETNELVNYAYSTVLGTGWYKVGDRRVAVIELPFSWEQHKALQGERFGIRWLFPITVGLHNFTVDNPIPEVEDVGTVSILPGVELHFPLASGWQLHPFFQTGMAWDIGSSEHALVYSMGMRARYDIRPLTVSRSGITFGARGLYSGYLPGNENDNRLGLVSLGMDFRWPTRLRLGDRLTYVGSSVYTNLYFNRARFTNLIDDAEGVASEYTVTLGLGGAPDFRVLGIPFERVAVGYKYGRNIRAVILSSSFPF